jgi:hypothetical protein
LRHRGQLAKPELSRDYELRRGQRHRREIQVRVTQQPLDRVTVAGEGAAAVSRPTDASGRERALRKVML